MNELETVLDDFHRTVTRNANHALTLLAAVGLYRHNIVPMYADKPDHWEIEAIIEGRVLESTTAGEVRRDFESDGPMDRWVAQAWFIHIYDYWERVTRPSLTKIIGRNPSIDVMGDIRTLRHDIAHHDGIRSKDRTLKVLTHWATEGEPIVLSHLSFHEFIDAFPWNTSSDEWKVGDSTTT